MDKTTKLICAYAVGLTFDDLGPEVVHQVKRIVIDTLGCAMGGFTSRPAQISRDLALRVTSSTPSRILGTDDYSSPDMAAFANGVMLRYLDCNDSYFSPGGGHPSDMIPAAMAPAGPAGCDGPTFITSVALAYEVFCRLSDKVVASSLGWDQGMFGVIGAAVPPAKRLGWTGNTWPMPCPWPSCQTSPWGSPAPENCPCGRDAPAPTPPEPGYLPHSWLQKA